MVFDILMAFVAYNFPAALLLLFPITFRRIWFRKRVTHSISSRDCVIWSRRVAARKSTVCTTASVLSFSSRISSQSFNNMPAYLNGRFINASVRAAAEMPWSSVKTYSADVLPAKTGFFAGSGMAAPFTCPACASKRAFNPRPSSSAPSSSPLFSRSTALWYSAHRCFSNFTTSIASMSLSAPTIERLSAPVATGAESKGSSRPDPTSFPGGAAAPTFSLLASSFSSNSFLFSR
mmetsp:Transcript_46970/g.75488  ORF Transcript_46970/g.75488 Transcript_46970/m.75488 type:complete len:234 (+) Transcript_46970:403-1104(+)